MTLRRVVANVALLCASLLGALGVVELALRMVYPPPARFFYPQEAYDFDAEAGHTLRPRQSAFTHDRPVEINSMGLRDHELSPEPPAGTTRVLALGDSHTFGNGLELSETWPKQLERQLQEGTFSRWEVVNAGIPGTDTWQHEILLGRLVMTLKPHAVVLALYVNDVVPRHEPDRADATGQTNTSSKRLVYLAKRSAVVTWLYQRAFLPWQARRQEREASVEEAVLLGRSDPRAERGWQQVERSLTAMKGLCETRRVPLLVAILPRRDQVSGAVSSRAYDDRAHAVAAAHGIEGVDLLPSLSAEYRVRGEALFVPWDGHNSAIANRVIAIRLAEALRRLVRPPTGAGP